MIGHWQKNTMTRHADSFFDYMQKEIITDQMPNHQWRELNRFEKIVRFQINILDTIRLFLPISIS